MGKTRRELYVGKGVGYSEAVRNVSVLSIVCRPFLAKKWIKEVAR